MKRSNHGDEVEPPAQSSVSPSVPSTHRPLRSEPTTVPRSSRSAPDPTVDTEFPPDSLRRDPMPTLPDGVPSSLWEEAVESERRLTIPAIPEWFEGR